MVEFILGFVAGVVVFGMITLTGFIFITHGYQGDVDSLEEEK